MNTHGEMFTELEKINTRPKPFEFYTAPDLWTDEHTSKQMLAYHLNGEVDLSSRKAEFINRSVEWIVSHFKVGQETRIADFGCGPGLYTTKLADAGAEVTGIDLSQRSIQYARETAKKTGLNINYIHHNYLNFETDLRFDLLQMIMCDFCALSPDQRETMLKTFHKVLEPGGAVLLDVYSLHAFEAREETATYEVDQLNGFWSHNRYFGFVNTFKYPEEKVMLDKYTIIEKDRARTVYNWLQYFSPAMLEAELKRSGFSIESTHSDVAGTPYDEKNHEFAVVARKEE